MTTQTATYHPTHGHRHTLQPYRAKSSLGYVRSVHTRIRPSTVSPEGRPDGRDSLHS